MIKLYHFLAAFFAGTFIYVFVSLSCGRDGLWANSQLREQKRILSAHTEQIQKINNGLQLEYNALNKDPDVIAAFARKLGFVRNGEKIVKISGRDSSNPFIFETGTPIESETPRSLPEWLCKVSGILMGAVVFLYLFVSDYQSRCAERARERKERAERAGKTPEADGSGKNTIFVKGIPVYDMPQV